MKEKDYTVTNLKVFLDVFDKLCSFEAQSRMNRGYGIDLGQSLPIPEVVLVYQHLKMKMFLVALKGILKKALDKNPFEENSYSEYNTLDTVLEEEKTCCVECGQELNSEEEINEVCERCSGIE